MTSAATQGVNPLRILIESLAEEGDDRFFAVSFEAPVVAYGPTPENALATLVKTVEKTAEEHLRVHGNLVSGFYRGQQADEIFGTMDGFFEAVTKGAKPQWHPLSPELERLGVCFDGLLVIVLGA